MCLSRGRKKHLQTCHHTAPRNMEAFGYASSRGSGPSRTGRSDMNVGPGPGRPRSRRSTAASTAAPPAAPLPCCPSCAPYSPMPTGTPSAPPAPTCIHLHRQSAQPRNHLRRLFLLYAQLSQTRHPAGRSGINLGLRAVVWPARL